MVRLLENHPELRPFADDILMRIERYRQKRAQILGQSLSLKDFANAHQWYGFHKVSGGFVYREWAPGADNVYLAGDFNGWDKTAHPLTRKSGGNWVRRP